MRIWTGKVSYDVTDVTVPLKTLFYCFSEEAEVNLEITSIKLTEISILASLSGNSLLVQDNKLYCCGKKKGNDLLLLEDGKEIILRDFFNLSNEFEIEFV